MTDARLDVQQLNAWYGQAQALFDVSLTVHAGELVVLQGRRWQIDLVAVADRHWPPGVGPDIVGGSAH